jgi:hypothetical protein
VVKHLHISSTWKHGDYNDELIIKLDAEPIKKNYRILYNYLKKFFSKFELTYVQESDDDTIDPYIFNTDEFDKMMKSKEEYYLGDATKKNSYLYPISIRCIIYDEDSHISWSSIIDETK